MSTNKIIKKSIILELPETLESGSAKIICETPEYEIICQKLIKQSNE